MVGNEFHDEEVAGPESDGNSDDMSRRNFVVGGVATLVTLFTSRFAMAASIGGKDKKDEARIRALKEKRSQNHTLTEEERYTLDRYELLEQFDIYESVINEKLTQSGLKTDRKEKLHKFLKELHEWRGKIHEMKFSDYFPTAMQAHEFLYQCDDLLGTRAGGPDY